MESQFYRSGDVLFRKGDPGAEMFYWFSAADSVAGVDVRLGAGALLGEIGLFSPERRRTATVVCESDCELRVVRAADAIRLYYQEPEFALHLIRLLASRLNADNCAARRTSRRKASRRYLMMRLHAPLQALDSMARRLRTTRIAARFSSTISIRSVPVIHRPMSVPAKSSGVATFLMVAPSLRAR